MTNPEFLPINALVLRVVITRSADGGYVATCSELDAQVTGLTLEDLTVQLQSLALSLFRLDPYQPRVRN